jgi:hypothetical protein
VTRPQAGRQVMRVFTPESVQTGSETYPVSYSDLSSLIFRPIQSHIQTYPVSYSDLSSPIFRPIQSHIHWVLRTLTGSKAVGAWG